MAKVLGNSNNNCVIRARQAWHAVKKAVRKLDPYLPYLYGLVGPVGSLKIINEYGAFNLYELEGADFFEVVVTGELGLHARPTGAFTEIAHRFKSEIRTVGATDREDEEYSANSKSNMQMLSLYPDGIPRDSKILIYAKGEDQQEAIAALAKLFVVEEIGRVLHSTVGIVMPVVPVSYQISTELPPIPNVSFGCAFHLNEELYVEKYRTIKLEDDPTICAGEISVEGLCEQKIRIVIDAFASLVKDLEPNGDIGAELMPLLMEIQAEIVEIMEAEKVNAAFAVRNLLAEKEHLRLSGNEKSVTIYWSIYKICAKMLNIKHGDIRDFNAEIMASGFDDVIVVCDDLSDTDIGLLDNPKIRGILRRKGSKKDHISIEARAREKASLYGLGSELDRIADDDFIVVDECEGKVIINPDEEGLKEYSAKEEQLDLLKTRLEEMREKPAETRDGRHFQIFGNVIYPHEIEKLRKHGNDGVGLVRTEYFYIEIKKAPRDVEPSPVEQVDYYQGLIDSSDGRRLIIRTLDPEEDKMLPYFDPLYERENREDILGRKRGIGVCLDKERYAGYHSIFKSQLAAILQTRGPIDVMFPVVRKKSEFEQAMELIERTRNKLKAQGIEVNKQIRFGSMIEHPDILDEIDNLFLHPRLEFISFGTTDLTQYITGVKRTSTELSRAFDERDPRVLKVIQEVTAKAKAHDIYVSCCGDMANDWTALLWLWGVGIESISLDSGVVDLAKKIASCVYWEDLKDLVTQVSHIKTAKEVRRYIQRFTKEKISDGRWAGLEDFMPLLFPREVI